MADVASAVGDPSDEEEEDGVLPPAHHMGITKRAHTSLLAFRGMVGTMRRRVSDITVRNMLEMIIAETGYEEYARKGEDEKRWQNVMELVATADELPARLAEQIENDDIGLEDLVAKVAKIQAMEAPKGQDALRTFLETAALVSEADRADDAEIDQVRLMTLHASKGLEFPIVFMVGLEEGILPSMRSVEQDEYDEEVRLAYVGMTRAKRRLYLLNARERSMYGRKAEHEYSRIFKAVRKELDAAPARAKRGRSARASSSAPTTSFSRGRRSSSKRS